MSRLDRVTTFWSKASTKLRIFALEALLRPLRPPFMVRFGSYYGGWWVPRVEEPGAVAVCVGAGTDVSFDLELLRLGYEVHTVDPTPDSLDFLAGNAGGLNVVPVGVWTHSGEVSFDRDRTWTQSWSIAGTTPSVTTGVQESRTFTVRTVADLLADLGCEEVAVLKLDIEGAEHAVIRQMLGDGVRPISLGVEFDDHRTLAVLRSHRLLVRHGYTLYQIDGLNHLYVRD